MSALPSLLLALACGQWLGDADTDQARLRSLVQAASDRKASPAKLDLTGLEVESLEVAAEAAACKGNVAVLDALISAGARPAGFGPRALGCMARARCQSPVDIARQTCTPGAKPDDEAPMLATEKLLLDKGLPPNATESDGTPLLVRTASDCTPFAAPLVARGADVNAAKPDGTTALMASQDCPTGIAELLLDKGARADAKSKNGSTALHLLAVSRLDDAPFTARLQALRAKGARVDEPDAGGLTPLMWAVSDFGWREFRALRTRELLAAGADPSHRAEEGATPLLFALGHDCADCATVLLLNGASPKAVNKSGWSPAFLAAGHQLDAVLKSLLDAGADPNAVDANGSTPLHNAALSPCPACIAPLLAKGAKIDLPDKKGRTPLHVAVASSTAVLQALLAAGANPNAADAEGSTPLHLAALGHAAAIAPLLANKAAIEARDAKGRTPLLAAAEHTASLSCYPEEIAALVAGHADLSAKDSAGRTAYDIVVKAKCADRIGHLFAPRRSGPQPGLSRVTASTTLVEKGQAKDFYAPEKATDGKLSTCWCKQTRDIGAGQWLQLDFARPSTIKALRVYPGCGESAAIYSSNNRLRAVEVSAGASKTTSVTLEDDQRFHDLGIASSEPVSSLRLTVTDVYGGSKYNDTCIAEVQVDLE